MRIGDMAGIDPESLAFCFEALVKGTDLEPLELDIEPGGRDELEFCISGTGRNHDPRSHGRQSSE